MKYRRVAIQYFLQINNFLKDKQRCKEGSPLAVKEEERKKKKFFKRLVPIDLPAKGKEAKNGFASPEQTHRQKDRQTEAK